MYYFSKPHRERICFKPSQFKFRMDTSLGKRGHSQVQGGDSSESVEDRPSTSRPRFEEIIPSSNLPSEALRDVYGDLTKMLHSSSLLEDLYSARLLTDVEYETIKSKGSNHDQNIDVLAAVRGRSEKDVLQFCQLLFTHKQHNCGSILFTGSLLGNLGHSDVHTPKCTKVYFNHKIMYTF